MLGHRTQFTPTLRIASHLKQKIAIQICDYSLVVWNITALFPNLWFLMFVALEFNSSCVSDGSLNQKWYHPIAQRKSECQDIPSYGVLMRICTD